MSTETELKPGVATDSPVSETAPPAVAAPADPAAATAPVKQPSRLRRWTKRIAITLGILVVVGGIGAAFALQKMKEFDAQHAEFLSSGKTVNNFLKDYASSVSDAFKTGSPDAILAHYSEGFASPERGSWQFDAGRDIGDVDYFTLEKHGSEAFDRTQLGSEFSTYLKNMSSVDAVVCKINLVEKIEPDKFARLTVKYILDGKDHQGKLFQDRFFFRWWIEQQTGADGLGVWRITKDEFVEGVRVAGSGHGFERVSPQSLGIDFVHKRNPKLDVSKPEIKMMFAVVEHASGGVTSMDYNGDGLADLFFPDGVQSRLYRNAGPAPDSPNGHRRNHASRIGRTRSSPLRALLRLRQ
ncbi:MAG: hypothetical protein O3A00_03070 [Planctomycetota bacterium]|nr:hypothetical protein [Planctomycetota bacterium]